MEAHTRARLVENPVRVPTEDIPLEGNLTIPANSRGIVLFAHGSGSSRHSPRNRFVAKALNGDGLATLLIDLLTPAEDEVDAVTRWLRFDIDLLARRLIGVVDWLDREPETRDLRLGLFGASTGAAVSLIAATDPRSRAVSYTKLTLPTKAEV
jgi:putative phosphoribosyl transferase